MTLLTNLGPVFYKLVYMSLTGLAAGAIVLLLRRLADRRFSPFWKYAMWLLVLAAFVVPWRPQSRAAVLSPAEAVQTVSFREEYSRAQTEYATVLAQVPQAPQASPEVEAARREATSLRMKTLAFDELLPLLWLCGTAGAAAFMGIAAIRLRRRVRRSELVEGAQRCEALLERCKQQLGVKRRVRVVLQSHVGTPALMGLLRPVILLPGYAAGMSDARLEYVILHELSHLRRRDHLVNALLLAVRAVYWFNPLVWLLLKFVREDMELANDAAVLRGMGQEAQKEYSLSLVEVLMGCTVQKQKHAMLCMTDGKKNIERRIGMIQLGEFFKKRKWIIAVAGVLAIAGIAALFLTTGVKRSESYNFDSAGVAVTMQLPRGMSIPAPPGAPGDQYYLEQRAVHRAGQGVGMLLVDPLEYISEEQMDIFMEDPEQNCRALFQQLPMGGLAFINDYRQVWMSDDGAEGSATLLIYQKYPFEEGQSAAEVDYYPTRAVLAYNLTLNRYVQITLDYGALTDREHIAFAKSLRLKKLPMEQRQSALMTSLGYTQAALETIQKNKTPYVGENAKVGAIIYQLPVTWKGLAYDHFALHTNEEPYGLSIQYQRIDENSLTDWLQNPFSAAMEENNALLLFAAIENLGVVTFAKPADMQTMQFTRDDINAIFGGIPSTDDLDGIYEKLSNNLKIEEFYFAHAGRLYLRTSTPGEVVYRNGEPEVIFTNPSGLTVYGYRYSSSYSGTSGKTITNDDATAAYYYFKGSELYATRGVLDVDAEWERYDDLVSWYGQPTGEMSIDGQRYIAYLLRKDAPDEPDKYAWFMIENDREVHSGLMLGDDYTILSTSRTGIASPPVTDPNFDADALFRRLEGYWNDHYEYPGFTRFMYRDGKPSMYSAVWDGEGSDAGTLTDGQSTGEDMAALTFWYPAMDDNLNGPRPERTETMWIDFTGLDNGTIRIKHETYWGTKDWHVHTFGGKTEQEAAEKSFASRPPAANTVAAIPPGTTRPNITMTNKIRYEVRIWHETTFPESGSDGPFPEDYAGVYWDDWFYLHVILTDDRNLASYREQLGENADAVIFEYAQFNLTQLYEVMNCLIPVREELDINTVRLNEIDNRIDIGCKGTDTAKVLAYLYRYIDDFDPASVKLIENAPALALL